MGEHELQSEAVKDCAESVQRENPDLTKSQAFAICQSMENEGNLSAGEIYDAIHALGIEDEVDDDVLDELDQQREATREQEATLRVHRGLALGQGIRRTEHGDGSVTYHNIAILAPGEWTDAATEQTVFYAPEANERIAENPDEHVVDTGVNLNHAHQDQLAQVGAFDPESLTVDDAGVLYADVTLHGRTTASEDAIELMDLALESDGERGAGGPSVEIPREGEVTEWDDERGMERMVQFNLAGLAIVTESASEDVAFDQQFAERAVAMADGGAAGVRVMRHAGEMPITQGRRTLDMDADELRSILQDETMDESTVRDIVQDELADGDGDEPEHELMGEAEAAAVVDDYLMAEGAPDDGVDALLEWARANTDADIDALERLAADYLTETDAEGLDDTPVSEFMAFLEEMADDESDAEEGGGEDEEEMGEHMAAAEEEIEELQGTIDELERRLQELEDEPKPPRSMGETGADAEADEEPDEASAAAGTVGKQGDWIGY